MHTARLTGLKHSSKYHYRVRGTDSDGNEIFSDDYTFETITFPEVTAYVLKTDQNAGGTTISVAWATNVATNSVVDYQMATIDENSNNQNPSNPNNTKYTVAEMEKMNQADLAKIPVTTSGEAEQVAKGDMASTHLVRLSNLKDGVMYIITMRGRDKYGNEAVSEPLRYVTGKDTRPPVISNVSVESQISGSGAAATAQIIISWETDEPATTQVLYGAGVGSEYPLSSPEEQGLTKRHTVVIRDLAHTSSYHLRIVSKDETGNIAKSGDLIAVTPPSQESALDVVLANLEDVFGFLRI